MSERTIKGRVQDCGGGIVDVLMDREGEEYPPIGAEVTLTIHESRFYVLAPFGGPKATVFERESGPKADFFGKNAVAYAEEHADRLNREAQS